MKSIKRIIAILLVAVVALSFSGCHKKGETAVKVGDMKFSSGYYACALLEADTEARSIVYQEMTDAGEDTTDIKYSKHKVEGKKYDTWVKDRAIAILKEIAAASFKCKAAKVEQDSAKIAALSNFINAYWDDIFALYSENNGVSKETFIRFFTDYNNENSIVSQALSSLYSQWYQNALTQMNNGGSAESISPFPYNDIGNTDYKTIYFDSLYADEMEKAPSDKEYNAQILKDYVLAGQLSVNLTTTDSQGNSTPLSEDEIKKSVKELTGYKKDLEAGKVTFDEVMHQHEGAEDHEHEEAETDEKEVKPITEHATPMTDGDAYFEDVSALEIGKVTIKGLKEDGTVEDGATQLVLLFKLDLSKDVHYINELRTGDATRNAILHSMKDAELDAELAESLKTLSFKEVKSVTKQFKVSKLKYPQ